MAVAGAVAKIGPRLLTEEDSLSNDQSWRSAMAVTEGMIEVVIMNYCTVENSVLTF